MAPSFLLRQTKVLKLSEEPVLQRKIMSIGSG